MRQILLGMALCAFCACSSVPDFKPSRPVEEASSADEAITICGEYRIKGETSESGAARPAPVAALVPWMRCFESALRKFPALRAREGFVAFFRELTFRHDTSRAGVDSIDWPTMNDAVAAAARHFEQPGAPLLEQELKALGRQLPGFWIYLAEHGNAMLPPQPAARRERDLSDLRRELGEPMIGRPATLLVAARPQALSEDERAYCRKYVAYRGMLHSVEELVDYQRLFAQNAVSGAEKPAYMKRLDERVARLKTDIPKRRVELASTRAHLQERHAWFRDGHCFQK
jgi:hypothetical protein